MIAGLKHCLWIALGLVALASDVYAPATAQDPRPAPAVTIVKDGKARLPIFVGSETEPAHELRKYLGQISGADFTIEKPKEKAAGIYVGMAADFPALAIGLPADLGDEGFILKTDGTSVFLLANNGPGVQHAVTAFLHRLGCRWFFPGKTWEVVPRLPGNVVVRLDERQSPSFPVARRFSYGFGAFPPCAHDFKEWCRHNHMGGASEVHVNHSWFGLDPARQFKDHPEWFALVNGKRTPAKPCYSHPDVIKQGIDHALSKAAAGERMVSLSPPDGLSFCECERCRAAARGGKTFQKHLTTFANRPDGTVVSITSENLFHFVNEVAGAVAAKYPKMRIGCMAYSAYSHPPSFPLHPNVFLQVTTAYRRTDLTLPEQMTAFNKKGCQGGIRDYFSVYQWDWDAAPPADRLSPAKLPETFQAYRKLGVVSLNAEASNNWAPRGLSYYLISQLLWDVNVDTRAVMHDFFDKAFGPAAAPMKRFYTHWHGAAGIGDEAAKDEAADKKAKGLTSEKLTTLFVDLDEAARLAKADAPCLARVDHLRMYLHYLVLRENTQKSLKTKNDKAMLDAVRTETIFGGRLTYTNMIHSRPLLGKAFLRRFKPFEKLLAKVPEASTAGKGWRAIGQPPSHEELERFWAEDRLTLMIK